jgi:DNA-binding NarL/FixJ family response regulator
MLAALTEDGTQDRRTFIEFPRHLNVLVVEDDFADYDAVARALRKMEGFEVKVTRAKTVEAARRAVVETRFDVCLIDYNLGAESGLRFLQDLGGRGGSVVAILLTGLLDRQVHETSLRAGVIACLSKDDLSPTLLETSLRSAFYTHRLEAELADLVRQAFASGSLEGPERNVAAGLKALASRMPWLPIGVEH